MNALSITGLTVRFGSATVLRDVGLELARGEMFVLLGSNGAGKSTLLRAVCGLLPWVSGQVVVADWNIRRNREQALAQIGYVAQRFSLYNDLTVEENLSFYARCYGLRGEPLTTAVRNALERFGLNALRGKTTSTLSHGWRQRLSIASATAHAPSVLLLDEATAGLDRQARRDVLARLQEFASEGVAILLTTHYEDDAASCHRTGSLVNESLVIAPSAGRPANEGGK